MKSTGLVLARNALLNFLTQVGVGLVAVASIPFIVQGIGEEVFGLLTMIWMVVGYFSILDLGVGQASVKFLAEHIVRREADEVNTTIWVSVGVSLILGLFTSALIIVLSPVFIEDVFQIPVELRDSARVSFYWVCLAVPFVMLQGALRSVPVALQRFDLVNAVQGVSGLLQWGGSLLLVIIGLGLFEVVLLTIVIRILAALVSHWIAVKLLPGLSLRRLKNVRGTLVKLLKFGSWVTISHAVSPVVRYLDRIFVASYHSLRMFTYYAVPYEAISRLQVIPMSVATTLYPALSERFGSAANQTLPMRNLYVRALNLMLLLILPISIVLVLFSHQILSSWLGGDFPLISDNVFKLLAVAISVHAIGYIPLTALQAAGKPDVVAKFNVLEIPVYIALCWVLIPRYGIEGAAWAWLIRLSLLTSALLWAANRYLGGGEGFARYSNLWRGLVLNTFTFCAIVYVSGYVGGPVVNLLVLLACVAGAYAIGVWSYCLDVIEREVILKLFFRHRRDLFKS